MTEREKKIIDRLEASNWEALALSRVARHVDDLPRSTGEAEDFGWEEGILEKLRKRLAEPE